MPVSPGEFRGALRRWASGVSIVTTRGGRGVQGITVASFCSLSLDPPLILICINRSARSHRLITEQRCFGVNILRQDQQPLSDIAAGRALMGGGLGRPETRTASTGAPILPNVLAWLDCALVEQHEGGDHTIFVGRVEAAGHGDGTPLVWFSSGYCGLREDGARRGTGIGRQRAAARRHPRRGKKTHAARAKRQLPTSRRSTSAKRGRAVRKRGRTR